MTVIDRGSVEDLLAGAPTKNEKILEFVKRAAELTTPDRIEWITGDEEQRQAITDQLVEAGTLVKLSEPANSYYAKSDPALRPCRIDCMKSA